MRLARRIEVLGRGGESGFTLIEVVVGALLVSIGLISLVGVLDSSRDLANGSERRETALHRAELEMEKTRAYAYDCLATSTTPSTSANPKDPRYYVQSGSPTRYRWDQLSSTGVYDQLVVNSAACPTTGGPLIHESTFTDGRLTGKVYRFVTWVDDNGDGTSDMKRVTVAVTIDQDPNASPVVLSTLRDERA